MNGSCHMCGKCCEAIHIPMSPQEIRNMAEDRIEYQGKDDSNDDAVFVHLNWTPMTKEEAYKVNPYFADNERRMKESGGNAVAIYDSLHFYSCNHHDKGTGKCTIHEIRPAVCSGYPWYGRAPEPTFLFYSPDCGYIADLPKEDV